MIWGLVQSLLTFGLCLIFLLVGWAIGWEDGKKETQLKIERMRRAINANRQG